MSNATKKAYWRIFWEQPEIADSILTSTQKELWPLLGHMVNTSKKDRENSQMQFGFPVTMPRAAKPEGRVTTEPVPRPRAVP